MKMKRIVSMVAIVGGIGIGTIASQQPVQAAKSFYITFVRKGYTYDTKGQVAVGKLPNGRWATVVSERNTKTKAYGIKYIHGQKFYIVHDKLAKPFSPKGQYVKASDVVLGKIKLKKIKKVKKPSKASSGTLTITANSNTGKVNVTYGNSGNSKKIVFNDQYVEEFKQAFLNLVNDWRKSNGTSALSLNSELNQYAAKRANDQKNGLDNHAGFINDPNNPSHAENIGYVSIDTPAKYAKRIFYEMVYNDAASNWGHRDNLANPSLF